MVHVPTRVIKDLQARIIRLESRDAEHAADLDDIKKAVASLSSQLLQDRKEPSSGQLEAPQASSQEEGRETRPRRSRNGMKRLRRGRRIVESSENDDNDDDDDDLDGETGTERRRRHLLQPAKRAKTAAEPPGPGSGPVPTSALPAERREGTGKAGLRGRRRSRRRRHAAASQRDAAKDKNGKAPPETESSTSTSADEDIPRYRLDGASSRRSAERGPASQKPA